MKVVSFDMSNVTEGVVSLTLPTSVVVEMHMFVGTIASFCASSFASPTKSLDDSLSLFKLFVELVTAAATCSKLGPVLLFVVLFVLVLMLSLSSSSQVSFLFRAASRK